MKKVLFLCYYFPPIGMGGTQRSAKFVKYLPAFNWKPIVVTVKDIKYYAKDETLLDEIRSAEIIRTESLDPLRLFARFTNKRKQDGESTEVESSKRTSKLLNFLNQLIVGWLLIPDSKILWLPFALKASLKLIKTQKIGIVYTTSPPHSAHLGGLILKLIAGVKWVADFRDDWTGGESQPSPTIFHCFTNRLFEKFVLKSADQVVAMCDHLSTNLKKKSGCQFQTNKFNTVTNGYDLDDFSELINLPLHGRFTITHCGSISKVSDPEPFLKAMQSLFQQQPDLKDKIQLQFFGTDLYGRLDYSVNQLELQNNVQPIKYLPHSEALRQIMKSHLLLLTIFKRTNEEVITGKVFEYLGSGKPILLISSEGEVTRIIRSLNRGVVLNNKNIDGIKNAVLNYFQMFQQGNLKYSEPLSLPQFDRKLLAGQLADIFAEMQNQ